MSFWPGSNIPISRNNAFDLTQTYAPRPISREEMGRISGLKSAAARAKRSSAGRAAKTAAQVLEMRHQGQYTRAVE